MLYKPFIALQLKKQLPAAGLFLGRKGRRSSGHGRIALIDKVKHIRKAGGSAQLHTGTPQTALFFQKINTLSSQRVEHQP